MGMVVFFCIITVIKTNLTRGTKLPYPYLNWVGTGRFFINQLLGHDLQETISMMSSTEEHT